MHKNNEILQKNASPIDAPAETNDTQELWELVDEHLLHYGRDFVREFIVRASGSYIYTAEGRAIIDFSSGQMCATLGHNHAAILEAMERSAETVMHLDSTMLSPAIAHLGKELCDLLPQQLSKVLFLNTGAESNEAAIRLAKLYTGCFEIVGLTGSWHGTTYGAASSTYASGRKGYGPTMPGALAIPAPNCYRCPIGQCKTQCNLACLDFSFDYLESVSVGSTAAVIVEPIQSAGGIIVPPEGYLKRIREWCDERSILLIFDEAQTGLGRVGANFAFEIEQVVPDILSLSKTLGAGVPLAATVTSSEIAETTRERGFSHFTSHASDPLTVEVGLAVVRTLVTDQLAARADDIGLYLMSGLKKLQQRHEAIGDVRGRGLLIGVEIVSDRETRNPDKEAMSRISNRCFKLGLNINRVGGPLSVWRIAPPLTISKSEVDQALEIMDEAFASA
ncbi:MAG: aspartate aminotransferase family protein [Gammaproteobacteria bacterium]|nr:MAG: aspartate aminotransferase family protein [Gammaproteobacteria bacterium]